MAVNYPWGSYEGHFWLLQWWKIESSLKRWVGKLWATDGYGEGFADCN